MAELMMDAPCDATTRKLVPGSRSLLAADGDENTTSVDVWFGYDVHYRPQPVQSNYGNFTPRYVGLRNQVLGGLYFQQVRDLMRCWLCKSAIYFIAKLSDVMTGLYHPMSSACLARGW